MAIKSTTIGEGDGNIRPQPHALSQKTIFESKISQAEPQFIVENRLSLLVYLSEQPKREESGETVR